MKKTFRLTTLGLALATVSACTGTPAAPVGGLSGGTVNVRARVALRTPVGFKLMEAADTSYEAADVAKVKVYLTRADGDEQALGDFAIDGEPLIIRNLRMNTAYAVRLEAYMADGTRIDANADDQEGDTDVEGCETTFETTTAPELDLTDSPFKVTLLGDLFAGRASSNIEILTGPARDTEEAEAIDTAAPPPPPPVVDISTFFGGPFNSHSAAALDAQGNYYAGTFSVGGLMKITPAGGTSYPGAGYGTPTDVSIDADGNVFICSYDDDGTNRISKVDPQGVTTTFLDNLPYDGYIVLVDADGFVVAVDADRHLARYTRTDPPVRATIAENIGSPTDITQVGANYYLAYGETGIVRQVTPAGVVDDGYLTGLGSLESITADASGNLYVVAGAAVKKITPQKVVTTLTLPGIVDAESVVVAGAYLYIGDAQAQKILKYGL